MLKQISRIAMVTCLALVWALPAMAGGKTVDWSKKSMGRFLLEPQETLTFTLPPNSGPVPGGFNLVPSPEAVGGHFSKVELVNLKCDGCKDRYLLEKVGTPQPVSWTLEVIDKDKGGKVVYKNDSKGQLVLF